MAASSARDIEFLTYADDWAKQNKTLIEIWRADNLDKLDDSGWRVTVQLKDAGGWFGSAIATPDRKKGEEYAKTVFSAMSKLCVRIGENRIKSYNNIEKIPAGKAA